MSTSAALSFSPAEITFIADFLAGAADEFSEQSCDELCVPASHANLQALVPVIAWKIAEYGAEWTGATTPQAYLDSLTIASGELVLPHEWVAAFFSSQYSEALPAEISAAEIMIVGAVLDARAEMHEIWAEDDPDTETEPFTLPPTDANKTFMAAVCAYRGRKARSQKIMDATGPISVRIEWVMRYLAHRCKSLAADGDAVRIAATDAAPAVDSAGMPVLVGLGIAPRFPDVKKYLTRYTVNFPHWQAHDLSFLATYAQQGPGFAYKVYVHQKSDAYRNRDALDNVERCAMMLRWHAVQVALGAKLPKRATSKGASACTKRLEALRKNAPHVYAHADQTEVKEFKIAQYLLYDEAYTAADVEQAILDAAGITSIAPALRQAYAAKIVNDAATAPETQCFIHLREQAQDGLEAYRQEIGKDWTIPWRRSVAYRYRAIQMGAALPRYMRSTLQEFVPSIVHCLLLGWQDWALELWQRSHDRLTDGFAVLSEKKTNIDRRTQLFVLRLLDQWFDKKREAYPPQAYDEPIFEAVLAHWRHPDPAALAPLLLVACDRRTHAATGKGYSPDLECDAYWYDPYEVLLVLHLRRELGLSNPVLDHLVMKTPLATLPAPAARFEETLLDGIMARFNAQFSGQPAPEVFDQITFV